MPEARYKSIAELLAAVQSGEVDETQLEIIMDNDCSDALVPSDDPEEPVSLFEGRGYYDVEPLWKALFPTAMVRKC